jgi:hypothetical protein
VPLCRGHHREVHRCGDEAAWWSKAAIDPVPRARTLWLRTRPLPKNPDTTGVSGATPASAVSVREIAKRDRPVRRRRPDYKTKPIIAAGPSSTLS